MKLRSFVFLIFLFSLNTVFAKDKVVLCSTSGVIAPMSFRVLKEAYAQLGIMAELKVLPGERALHESNNGLTDGEVMRVAGVSKTYTNLVIVPVPVNKIYWVAVVKDKKIKVKTWEDLKPYTLGIMKGVKFPENKTKGMKVEPVPTNSNILQKVSSDRNDIGILTKLSALIEINKMDLKELTILEPPLDTTLLYHYLHKSNQDLVPKITKVLKKMERNGTIAKILDEEIQKLIDATKK